MAQCVKYGGLSFDSRLGGSNFFSLILSHEKTKKYLSSTLVELCELDSPSSEHRMLRARTKLEPQGIYRTWTQRLAPHSALEKDMRNKTAMKII